MQRMKLFHGSSNPDLARAVARYLGVPAGRARVARFSDGEIQVEIEENVRGLDCFVLQSTCAPANTPPDGAADHGGRAAPLVGASASRR